MCYMRRYLFATIDVESAVVTPVPVKRQRKCRRFFSFVQGTAAKMFSYMYVLWRIVNQLWTVTVFM